MPYWLTESGLSLVSLNNKLKTLLDCETEKGNPDNSNQRQSLELAYKLHGVLDKSAQQGQSSIVDARSINISIVGREKQLSDAVDKLTKLSSMMSSYPSEGEIVSVDVSAMPPQT